MQYCVFRYSLDTQSFFENFDQWNTHVPMVIQNIVLDKYQRFGKDDPDSNQVLNNVT